MKKLDMRCPILFSLCIFTAMGYASDVEKLTGTWDYNSYLVEPSQEQFDGAPLPGGPIVEASARTWAKGTLTLDSESPSKGTLKLIPTGLQLDVEFKLEEIRGVVRLLGTGTAQAGTPIDGAEYELAASSVVDKNGSIVEFVGSIRASKEMKLRPGYEPGGEPTGTVGLFKLTRCQE
jgi:hypothetical protein